MEITKEQILKIVDQCFHSYASSFRNEARQEATDLIEKHELAINYSQCCTQLPTIIEIDFDGHLKCQIETTDKAPTILKAVNGYGQPVDCNKDKIRINEI